MTSLCLVTQGGIPEYCHHEVRNIVYEKLIDILRKNKSIYDSSMDEHKDFVLKINMEAHWP